MNKKNILILEGGKNEEHSISLSTAYEVKKAIYDLNYNLQTISVDPVNFHKVIKNYHADMCFNALHGPFGEDGQIQKILYENNIPYTHSGVRASSIAFNKYLTKRAIKNKNINYLNSNLFNNSQLNTTKLEEFFKQLGSFVLKPVASGSSYGVHIIKSLEDINLFFSKSLNNKKLYENHDILMAEPFIQGKELTVAVIEENGIARSVEVTEIISKNIFFDYEAKYTKGVAKHILPAKIPSNIYQMCLNNAKIIHETLGCRGVSRSDFIYNEKSEKLFFLEINTQPGLTPFSLVPEQLNYNKIDFTKLIANLLNASLCQK